ncbi:MAG: glycosyltransferase [Hydrogenophaga sp.]|uniref:glycosyltransferase n=1 Tax=Hydrogenophaga sp. TaxID=1904254 RepID=UPI0040356701
MPEAVCHVVHFVYRFSIGGMENVVLQIVNHLPRELFRHTIIALTEVESELAQRIKNPSVELLALKKPPGQPWKLYPEVYRTLRKLKPDVVHSCNIAAMEFLPMATLAGVPLRVHVEHGMDFREISGQAPHYRLLRRLYRPFVSRYVAVSTREKEIYRGIGVPDEDILLIPNGVDTKKFHPRVTSGPRPADFPFQPGRDWVIGTVGRQADIKNPLLLVEAFISFVTSGALGTERGRLVMVGDGPLNGGIAQRMREAGLEDRLWLPGARDDVPDILRVLDCFVLPSLSEATSCALQEAMATALPIVATDVGGNAEILEHGTCGSLVPSRDAKALALQLLLHLNVGRKNPLALSALASVRRRYDLSKTLDSYSDLFLNKKTVFQPTLG